MSDTEIWAATNQALDQTLYEDYLRIAEIENVVSVLVAERTVPEVTPPSTNLPLAF
jgi:hypothetical protein